ncbi:MAG: hypothetical protein GKR87_03735 [Kiritimatiellae bacterium]|nr:hypothetical protein [Kiritimatiellia bacterium]
MAHSIWGVIIACGKSEVLTSGTDVAFLNLGANPVIVYSMLAFEQCRDIEGVVIIAKKERVESLKGMAQMFGCSKVKKIVAGGVKRLACVQAGLNAVEDEASLVVTHEVSRPCVKPALISETIKIAKKYGSGVAATKIGGVVAQVPKGLQAKKMLDGSGVWSLQTPQAFKLDILLKALRSAEKKKAAIVDEASAFECIKKEIRLVLSNTNNIKIYGPDDLILATSLARV